MLAILAAGAGQPSAGLPQFDPEFFSSQLFWLVLTFGALYFVLSKWILPNVGKMIEDRRDRIQRDLAEADRMRVETDAALASYEKSLADARGRAQGIAKDTRDKLAVEVDRERQAGDQILAVKLLDTEKRIAENKARALDSVNIIAAETASAIVARLIGHEIPAAEISATLNQGRDK